jgi:endonuclease YncB( thermonuclease family)
MNSYTPIKLKTKMLKYDYNDYFSSIMINRSKTIYNLYRIIFLFLFLLSSCKERSYKTEGINSVESFQNQNGNKTTSNKNNGKHNSITGKVVGISDGDTFSLVFDNGFKIKVRLNKIDCPERKQAFSERATQELSNMIFNHTVRVDYVRKDGYGRVLGDVYVNNLYINEEMIKRGMAWHYKKYSDDKNFAQLEHIAYKNKVGLWQDPNAVPPWEFRKK